MSTATLSLPPRPDDVPLRDELLAELSFLKPLSRRPALFRFPSGLALRRYHRGDVIVRQGDPGRSAFYILTSEDVLAVEQARERAARRWKADADYKETVAAWQHHLHQIHDSGDSDRIAVLVSYGRAANGRSPDPRAAQTTLLEGELFGETSCLQSTPYPATAVAARRCYLLEMNADFLAAVQSDPGLRQQADSVYKARILRLQLRQLAAFRLLDDEELDTVRDAVELLTFAPGEVIREENDRCDSLFLIRSGVVKVVKHVSPLLGPADVINWDRLFASLRGGAGGLWRQLPESAHEILTLTDPGPRPRLDLLQHLNDWIKAPDAQQRRQNRLAVESVLAGSLRSISRRVGPECVLDYCSTGDSFGETGLLLDQPWSATCIAFGHPGARGRVELVRLPAATFNRLLRDRPAFRAAVKREVGRRRRVTADRLAEPVWDAAPTTLFGPAFEQLGLAQGRQLMLIDLDRCTRCDDCVRACADSHTDGRSRLLLDGPRIGKFLVPTTCRSCLDPLCLIGCPVGSIHRGEDRAIVVEDWCIGCGLCADSCPYGSIHMGDVGVLPEQTHGWRFTSISSGDPTPWWRPNLQDNRWPEGSSPFHWDRTLREDLSAPASKSRKSIAFRRRFDLVTDPASEYRLEITSSAENITVFINGHSLPPPDKVRSAKHLYSLKAAHKTLDLKIGQNLLAVLIEFTDPPASAAPLFQARIDLQPTADSPPDLNDEVTLPLTEKLTTRRAVVCDLCESTGSAPACVHACPHEAAFRVDARFEFPR